jgi:NitT/TauT family transport system permease protein
MSITESATRTDATPRPTVAELLHRRPSKLRRFMTERLPVILFPIALIVLWQWSVVAFDIKPYLLPTPVAVAQTFVASLVDGSFLKHGWVTLQEVLYGFAGGSAAGVMLGIAVARWKVVERTLYPLIVALQTIPKVALAPLIVTWLGFGMGSKVLTAALLAFFPVLVNSITGLLAGDRDRLDLMRSLQAGPWQTLRYVRLPSALPYIFAGLRIAIVFSVIGAIVGEFVGAEAGLGYLIRASQTNLDAATTFAVIVLLSIMGLVLHSLVKFAERRLIFWQKSDSDPVAGV